VLRVIFRDAQRFFLDGMLQIHYAHTRMLARQGIIPQDVAAKCIEALDGLDREHIRQVAYDGQCEDLFFYVEELLERAAGPENAGHMHTARSRNDIAITLYRMRLRAEILHLIAALSETRRVFLVLAEKHIETLMPAYTHTQPAQPITFAHYLLAALELMGRDERRLQAAYATVNRSPMGACAISTTGFPIDRHYVAELLGFDGLQLNSYGAIAATDYLTETCSALSVAMINLGRVAQDFLLWSTAEFNYLRLSNAWVQISSIMPQKRNPVPLEHIRILASKSFAQAQGVLTCLHNTPFGDINDAEDDLQPLLLESTSDGLRAIRLMGGVMADCQVNVARMSERAHSDFLTVTELADTLVRSENISFREAHHMVSNAVKALHGHYSPEGMVDQLPANLKTPRAELLKALDPRHFVNLRTHPGGPAPEAVKLALADAELHLADTDRWLATNKASGPPASGEGRSRW
jgi:argininosuccinate lyase